MAGVRFLVSVTDPIEARDAARGGADIIDVKDPATGSLGEAPAAQVRAIREIAPPDIPVSAALGDGPFETHAVARAADLLSACGAKYVKVGLRHTARDAARDLLRAIRRGLPAETGLIAVGFADFLRARCPAPADLPALAAAAGADGCLVDTLVKDGQGLFRWLDDDALTALVAECRARDLLCGLAGSLAAADFPRLAAIRPDIVGVRGAACVGDRVSGRISADRVAALALQLRGPAGARAVPAR